MSAPRKPPGAPPPMAAGSPGGPPPRPGAPPSGPLGGPPAAGGAPGQIVRGVGAPAPRAGPPPPTGPPATFKPPPVAPPPRTLISQSRPDVDKIKPIQSAAPPPRGLPGQMAPAPGGLAPPAMPPNLSGRGPPPRGPAADFKVEEYKGDGVGPITASSGRFVGDSAAAEKPMQRPPATSRKAGSISAFEEPAGAPAGASEPKRARIGEVPFNPGMQMAAGQKAPPGVLGPPRKPVADPTSGELVASLRPSAPHIRPVGIPDDVEEPPTAKPVDPKNAPPPVRQVPDRGRAPPRIEPGVKPKPADPTPPEPDTAPTKRGKVVKEEVVEYVPRRERAHPEFESSSDEEDNKADKKDKVAAKPAAAPAVVTPAKPAAAPAPQAASEIKGIKPSAEELKQDMDAKKEIAKKMGKEEPALEELPEQSSTAVTAPPPVLEIEDEPLPPMSVPPSLGVSLAKSQFVPPPPEEFEPTFDTSKISQTLTSGRISIRCIEGINVRRKDEVNKIPKQDVYLKLKLGAAERHPWKQTSVQRKVDDNPSFKNEVVFFDMVEPSNFVMNGDLVLTIEALQKGTFKDESMGSITLSVVRFCKQPFIAYEERLPLLYPGQKTSTSKVAVEIVFEEARPGIFSFKLYSATGLRNVDPLGQQNPYVKFKLGPQYIKKSKATKNGGVAPYFAEEEVLMWADRESWKDDLQVTVLDEDLGDDKPIGGTHFCLLPYMNTRPADAKETNFDLFYTVVDAKDDRIKNEFSQGQLMMKVAYYPAGKLKLTIDRGRGLMFPDTHQVQPGATVRMDPYVVLTAESKAAQTIKRTPADKDGGVDPVWQQEINFDIVDQYQVNLDVMNQATQGSDVLLGTVMFSLLPTFRSGKTEQWLTLKQRKASGGIIEVGTVFLIAEFQGPTGVAFPQLTKEVDSFDDTVRALPQIKPDEDELDQLQTKKPYTTLPHEDTEVRELGPKKNDLGEEIVKQEFQDHEILAAFKFIDLDHNNFIGAKEIRHILVCMGEMITDEEIDMMIKMVDMDGDGQVSFTEFRTLVLHPDPGLVDMHKEVNAEKDKLLNKERQAAAGKSKGTDLSSYQRQRELTSREAKKAALIQFITDNEVTFDYVKQAYQVFIEFPREKRPGGRVPFKTFCEALGVEALTQTKQLHQLFDNEEMGDVDFREVLLGMMNFIEVDREERIQFSFIMFDELKTGYISHKEVEEILRGNHMIGILSVQRKADTVMRQASANASGSITMNEFVVVSKKFPNIMLPNIGAGKKKK
jgi:Ca2+-binding EF-hand superfamily protein